MRQRRIIEIIRVKGWLFWLEIKVLIGGIYLYATLTQQGDKVSSKDIINNLSKVIARLEDALSSKALLQNIVVNESIEVSGEEPGLNETIYLKIYKTIHEGINQTIEAGIHVIAYIIVREKNIMPSPLILNEHNNNCAAEKALDDLIKHDKKTLFNLTIEKIIASLDTFEHALENLDKML